MTDSTSENVRELYRAQLGPDFGDVFHGLWSAWAWSLMRRHEFRVLFTRGEDVSLLNALTGGAFTWDIQNVLWEDLLLRVCRLTDPPRSAGKRNLTVAQLPEFCKSHGIALYEEVQHLVRVACTKAAFARDWRNRRISHADLATVLGQAEPLAPASLEKVTSALDAVHAVLNTISNELMEAEIGNALSGAPRAQAFLSYARQLVESVQFVDAVVDADRTTRVTDTDAAAAFLEKLGLRPTMRNVKSVIELRQAARRFA